MTGDARVLARDSLVAARGPEHYWAGPFEDDIMEFGIRAARWGVNENDGGNRADLMLAEWAERGYPDLREDSW